MPVPMPMPCNLEHNLGILNLSGFEGDYCVATVWAFFLHHFILHAMGESNMRLIADIIVNACFLPTKGRLPMALNSLK